MSADGTPRVVQLYCRFELTIPDPDAVADMPGVAITGARWWAEPGPPSDRFEPGFGAPPR